MNILLVSQDNQWSRNLFDLLKKDLNHNYFYSKSCNHEHINNLNPDWIFFFHWGEIVLEEIYKNYRCVVLHTGNLPQARGGSPIQNQILDGIVQSEVNAIVMDKELDAGDIYYSLPITLQGSLLDIWLSISDIAYELIQKCITDNPRPTPQCGEPSTYKRIKNNKIKVDPHKDLCYIYNQIRMVDAEGYPNAYLNINGFKLEFTRAKIEENSIISDVRITKE